MFPWKMSQFHVGPPWFPCILYIYIYTIVMVNVRLLNSVPFFLEKPQWCIFHSAPETPKVFSSTLGTDHPLLLVAKTGEAASLGRMVSERTVFFLISFSSSVNFAVDLFEALFVCWHHWNGDFELKLCESDVKVMWILMVLTFFRLYSMVVDEFFHQATKSIYW